MFFGGAAEEREGELLEVWRMRLLAGVSSAPWSPARALAATAASAVLFRVSGPWVVWCCVVLYFRPVRTDHGLPACLPACLHQDLAVVPLLVAIPLLAGGGGGLAAALTSAATKAAIALGLIAFIGTPTG